MKKFEELFEDDTKNVQRVASNEYLENGNIAIVDQGKKLVVGYTDNENYKICKEKRIIFGDHTRIFKYVDIPFITGADGTKVLKLIDSKNNDYKYFYYYLQHSYIPNTGYNRHYKWVKELMFNVPGLEEQKEIAKKLDMVQEIINTKQNQLDELDNLIKSQFVEMFGDPINNQKGFPLIKVGDVFEFEGGSQPDKKYFEYQPSEDNIRLIQIRDYKSNDYITYIPKEKAKRFCTANDIMIGRYGPPIFQILKGIEGAYNVALMKAVPKKGNIEFLRQFLKQECLLHYLEGLSGRTAGQAGIEMPKLKNYPFPYPPLELQNQFANFVEHIDKLEFEQKKVCPVCE